VATIAINPDILQWAQVRSGIKLSELRKAFPKLLLWEQQKEQPTLAQVEKLAKRTHTPLGYFFLPQPPQEPLPVADFRTYKDRPVDRVSAELIDTIYAIQARQEWARDFIGDEGSGPVVIAGTSSIRDRPDVVADRIRRALHLGVGWNHDHRTFEDALRAFRERAEEAGVFVVINGVVGNNTHRKLDPDEFRGFVLPDAHAPFVFVNGADFKGAQMFTLAHELAHVCIGKGALFNLEHLFPANDPAEQFCNEVAAELLVPQAELRALWPQERDHLQRFDRLARRFKVSAIVVARRALDLKLIARAAYFDFYDRHSKRELQKVKASGGNFYLNQNTRVGRRFALAVATAAHEGRLSFRDAYRLTGLYGATFDRYIEKLGARL
jgi:Zn-dependent peptidase ImmA (M78 family)